jgi:undecaprenyl pyrophosphate synthase
LVFIDTEWTDLSGVHIEHAISEFAHRHRRFGGIE